MDDDRPLDDLSAYPSTSFGSSPEMETRLAALVLAGRKRATVWDGAQPNETAPGMRWIVTAAGRPVALIETVSVTRCRFDEIDAAFAFEEGEGDRSLRFWRLVHRQYFERNGSFSSDMAIWAERFRLIAVLDQDLAAASGEHVRAEELEAVAILRAADGIGDRAD